MQTNDHNFTLMDAGLDNNQVIFDLEDMITFETDQMRKRDYEISSKFLIKPDESQWSFGLLSILLNELIAWRIDEKNGCRYQCNVADKDYIFYRFTSYENKKQIINVNIGKTILVKASKELVESWQEKKINDSWF